jgi:HEAT repeat protein
VFHPVPPDYDAPMLLAWLVVACTPDAPPAPPGGAATGTPANGAAAQAARAAPMLAAPWEGAWTVTVHASRPGAASAGDAALAAGLGVRITDGTGARPHTRPGDVAVVWVAAGADLDATVRTLQPTPGAQGEVVAVLAPGEPTWAADAAIQLPWAGMAIVDPALSARPWTDTPLDDALAAQLAADVIADHYDLPYVPMAATYPPGLDAMLGPYDPAWVAAADPRTRAEAVRAWARGSRGGGAPPGGALRGDAPPQADPVVAVRLAVAETTTDPAVRGRLAADPDPLVRARAADGLDDVARLDALASDPSSVVRLVATARLGHLAATRPAEVEEALRRAVASPDAYQRWKAAWGLGQVPGTADALVPLLRDRDIDVRREAARSLGRLRDPAAVDALLDALRDDNSFVRRWAATALGDIGDPRARDALRAAAKDPTSLAAQAAARALTAMGEPTPAPPFTPPQKPRDDAQIEAWVQSADATVRKDACKFLAGRANAATWLPRLAADRDSEVRKSAAAAMGWSAATAVGAIPLLADPDPDVQVTALEALRRAGVGTVAVLAPLLADPDAEVRLRATEALATLGPSDALATRVTDPDERTRAAAVSVYPARLDPAEPSVLVRRAAGGDDPDPSAAKAGSEWAPWADGVLAHEDDLVHVRFSWNEPADRPSAYRALRPPVVRPYGHPHRG